MHNLKQFYTSTVADGTVFPSTTDLS